MPSLSADSVDERQALSIVRNTLRLENLGAEVAAAVDPLLRETFQRLSAQIEALPAEGLYREMRWRSMRGQVASMFGPPSEELYRQLGEALATEAPRQVDWAEQYLGDVANAAVAPRDALSSDATLDPQITRTQIARAAAEPQVLGRRLEDLFRVKDETPWQPGQERVPPRREKFPPFIRANLDRIDRTVKQGFILGETNQEIAKNLLSQGLAGSRREARVLARTAVMQMADDAHQGFWDANDSVIAGWEYDALLDYRVCPVCAPWDGRTARKRSDLPPLKRHPCCRCSVLPLTESEVLLREQQGPQRRTVVELVPYEGPDSKPAETATQRPYARPVTVDGKRYWRVARDIKQGDHPLTMGEFMAKTTDINLHHALGRARGAAFRKLVAGGLGADAALVRVTQSLRTPDLPPLTRSAAPTARPRVRRTPPPASRKPPRTPPPPPPRPTVAENTWRAPGGTAAQLEDHHITDGLQALADRPGRQGEHARQMIEFLERRGVGINIFDRSNPSDEILRSMLNSPSYQRAIARPRSGLLDAWVRSKGGRDSIEYARLRCAPIPRTGGHASPESPLITISLTPGRTPYHVGPARALAQQLTQVAQLTFEFLRKGGVPEIFADISSQGVEWLHTLIHETGHQVHFEAGELNALGKAAESERLTTGAGKIVSRYGLTNDYEHFAEAFSAYVLDPDGLEAYSQRTYDWVRRTMRAALR